jgi:hypothetical protein
MKMIKIWKKPVLLAALCAACGACTSTDVGRRESGAPPAYSQAVYRDPGVLNTPNNTGNRPEDLSPYTVHWRDVRPLY